MIPEKVFQQILALGEAWRVVRMDYQEKEQRVLIRVEEMPVLWKQESCPHCNSKSVRGYDHAPERRWRHLNVCQLQSETRRNEGKRSSKPAAARVAPEASQLRGMNANCRLDISMPR